MRIALVNDYSPDYIGGAFTSLLEQKKALEQAGHNVIVLQLGRPRQGRRFDEKDFIYIPPRVVLPAAVLNLPLIAVNATNQAFVQHILKKHQIEAVHAQSEFTLAHLTANAADALGISVFYTAHTFFWQFKGPLAGKVTAALLQAIFRRILRRPLVKRTPLGTPVEKVLKSLTLTMAERSRAVISPSKHQKQAMVAAGLQRPCHVVPNPFAGYSQTKPFLPKTGDSVRLAWIGRCAPEKHPLEFLQAVQQAADRTNTPFVVDIIGDGELLAGMKQRYHHSSIRFLGRQTHTDTIKLIDQSDIVCSSSYHFDNQPMIIAEAIARWRPVWYCDERLQEGLATAGYLTASPSIDDMATAIVEVVEDRALLKDLAVKARQSATIFAPETFVKKVVKLYQSPSS